MKSIKKIVIALTSLAMMLTMMPSVGATFDRTYTAQYGIPSIDGKVEDLWNLAEWTQVDKPHDGDDSSDSKCRVKLLWDEGFIHFLAEIEDKNLNPDNDIFEIYLDQKNDKTDEYGSDDSQTRFRVTGTVVTGPHAGKNAQVGADFVAKKIDSNKYIMEGSLILDKAPVEGQSMGIEFMYNDATSTSDFVEAYRWNVDTANGDSAPWSSTTAFGTLIFGKKGDGSSSSTSEVITEITTEDTTTEDTTVVDDSTSDTTVVDTDEEFGTTESNTTSVDTVKETNNENVEDSSFPVIGIIGIAVAVIAVAVATFMILKRKK